MNELKAVYEFTFTRRRVAESLARVRVPADALPVIRSLLDGRESEALVVLWLDSKNAVLGAEVVYTGSVNSTQVRVGEVFRGAIRMNAAGIIFAHNHPSGDPVPSPDDLHLTSQVIAAGRLLDIEVLDHIVVGEGEAYRSLRDYGISFDRRAN